MIENHIEFGGSFLTRFDKKYDKKIPYIIVNFVWDDRPMCPGFNI